MTPGAYRTKNKLCFIERLFKFTDIEVKLIKNQNYPSKLRIDCKKLTPVVTYETESMTLTVNNVRAKSIKGERL